MAWELYERHGADLVISDACQRRELDSAYRYGGVELLAVLPEQTLESAALAAERGRLADRLVARGLQGLGGAMVSPAALSIIRTTFAEGTERNRALAVWGAIAGAGGAVGLLLGGAIVQTLSWRWIFFINVPIGAVVLALASRIVPESHSESATGAGYDVEGAVAITLGTMTPLVPLRIFSNRSLAASDGTMLVVAAALFGVFFFCTLYLQQVLGFSALKTGIAYLPLSLSLIGASALASRFVDRFTPKPVLVAGLLVSTAGFVLLTRVVGHGDYTSHVLPAMIVVGVGLGPSFVPITIAATTCIAAGDSGLASGLLNTTQQVGGSLGLAILSSVSTSRSTSALHAGSSLPAALTHGFKGAFIVAAVLCAAGVGVAMAKRFRPG